MKLIWSPVAVERLEEIAEYIARDSPAAADTWLGAVFDRIDLIKRNPEMGRTVPEIHTHTIREIVFRNYRIIYRHTHRAIVVLTIRHFKQILPYRRSEPRTLMATRHRMGTQGATYSSAGRTSAYSLTLSAIRNSFVRSPESCSQG